MEMEEVTPAIALEPKAKLAGKVLKITLAGALIDIGQTVPGVVHISQLQKEPVNKVEDVLREGQSITAWVRRVRKDRVELTMIEPLKYDWKDLQPELVVQGKVVRLESYGAFVDIGAERPGMVHISEMARGYVKEAKDVVKEGDEVEAIILSVDPKKRQIRLSLKALQPEPAPTEATEREPRRGKRAKKGEEAAPVEPAPEAEEPQFTVMQLAWQAAQDRAKAKHGTGRTKRHRAADAEQEEILNRTLEKRISTGA